ncbi:MAG: hypothetical protein ACPGRZ_15055, partial [Alphaproteobacteria bacterium]
MAELLHSVVVENADDQRMAQGFGLFQMANMADMEKIADQVDIDSRRSVDRRFCHAGPGAGALCPASAAPGGQETETSGA